MRFMQRSTIAAAVVVAALGSAGAAGAHGSSGLPISVFAPASQGYSGSWPVTITKSQFSNGTGCLTLTGNASGGSASLVFGTQKYPYGSFIVRDGIFMATITEPLYGQNGALLFVVHASRSHLGSGLFENDEGGSDFDTGDLTFGAKNGC
jgi:hypothetical protein